MNTLTDANDTVDILKYELIRILFTKSLSGKSLNYYTTEYIKFLQIFDASMF